MRILITGGAGFIGSHFVDLIIKNDLFTKIFVIDKFTYAGRVSNLALASSDARLSIINADICDISIYESQLDRLDYIVNFAAESHVDNSIQDSSDFIQSNIVGVQKLLDFARNQDLIKFVQISTDEVYGSITEGSWDENQPLKPNSPYSASKASADLLVLAYAKTHGLKINITRCSNNFGERQFPEKLIPLAIKKILNNESVPIYGNGSNLRDWIYVKDHCEAIEKIMMSGLDGEVYNIGGSAELSNLELVNKILQLMGANSSLISFVSDRKGHDFRYCVNSSKILRDLNFKPSSNFDSKLADTISWYTSNRDWLES